MRLRQAFAAGASGTSVDYWKLFTQVIRESW